MGKTIRMHRVIYGYSIRSVIAAYYLIDCKSIDGRARTLNFKRHRLVRISVDDTRLQSWNKTLFVIDYTILNINWKWKLTCK